MATYGGKDDPPRWWYVVLLLLPPYLAWVVGKTGWFIPAIICTILFWIGLSHCFERILRSDLVDGSWLGLRRQWRRRFNRCIYCGRRPDWDERYDSWLQETMQELSKRGGGGRVCFSCVAIIGYDATSFREE